MIDIVVELICGVFVDGDEFLVLVGCFVIF